MTGSAVSPTVKEAYLAHEAPGAGKRLLACSFGAAAILLCGLALFGAFCALRSRALALSCAALCACAMVFFCDLFLAPCARYSRFLRSIADGLVREVAGTVLSASADTSTVDGASVYTLLVDTGGEGGEKVLYLPAWQGPRPVTGERESFLCSGRHILAPAKGAA